MKADLSEVTAGFLEARSEAPGEMLRFDGSVWTESKEYMYRMREDPVEGTEYCVSAPTGIMIVRNPRGGIV